MINYIAVFILGWVVSWQVNRWAIMKQIDRHGFYLLNSVRMKRKMYIRESIHHD